MSLGALGDSFYEYLLKLWVLTNKKVTRFQRLYTDAAEAVLDNLLVKGAYTCISAMFVTSVCLFAYLPVCVLFLLAACAAEAVLDIGRPHVYPQC